MPTPRFAIWYADGSLFEGGGPDDELIPIVLWASRDWLNAPATGILIVVTETGDTNRQQHQSTNYYCPIGDGEIGAAEDLSAFLLGKLKGAVKLGEFVPHEQWDATRAAAKAYERIPRPKAK